MSLHVAKRMVEVQRSLIRGIAEASNKPGIISFANGNPGNETYRPELFAKFVAEGFAEEPLTLCKYGNSLGYEPLRNAIKTYMSERWEIDFTRNEVLITAGGQQTCDYTTKVLLDEGDVIITEEPSFASCYNTFRSYYGTLAGVTLEEDGLNIEELEKAILENPNARIIYVIPNFQNPTGYTYSLEKRKAVYALAKQYNLAIFEDDPYCELRFDGEDIPPIKSFDLDGRVLYGGSFSKTVSPGLRIGFLIFDKELETRITVAKQVTDVHAGMINQYIAYRCMISDFSEHLKRCQDIYKHKRDVMIQQLEEKSPEGLTWNHPEGGLFITITFPEGFDTYDFAFNAIDNGVAVIPGAGFYIDQDKPRNTLRVCYSTSSDEEIIQGIDSLCTYAAKWLSKQQ
ncbi:PLP-dependent aminotransferase family protein [Sedimentibacter hydroxybenzoicus DSM 7310]|uniref:PLP-dependent aminotransferase family protein n=1 Tax=Sedimentibacter hydroxybenzoicus DSM 7310 TaxID=1123245 RepID=A0A974BLY4_SEDHY|nr:PLP-dependent aminotransferase family protein [Sedimentibacter hydroxybenzoicus]NYB75256.1 PLP-dependent aminotransferase family protein [Sedimentibacter hydroxybenzoicus DSM 7310]